MLPSLIKTLVAEHKHVNLGKTCCYTISYAIPRCPQSEQNKYDNMKFFLKVKNGKNK